MSLFLVASRLVGKLNRYRVHALVGLALIIILIGAGLFSLTQHVSYGTGVYWAITTATTVGYGDVTPHNTVGRIIASGVMLTTIPIVGAVFALLAGASALARIRRMLGMNNRLPTTAYTIVLGTHPVVPRVLDELVRTGAAAVLVAPEKPPGTDERIHFLAGDPTDESIIRRTDLSRAQRALIACTKESDTLVIAVAIHSMQPQLEVFALTQSPAVARALHELGIRHTLAGDELLAHTLAKSLEAPQAGDLLLSLVDSSRYRLSDRAVDPSLVSQPLSRARALAGTLVLGIAREDRVDLGVGDDPLLAADDRLVVLEQL